MSPRALLGAVIVFGVGSAVSVPSPNSRLGLEWLTPAGRFAASSGRLACVLTAKQAQLRIHFGVVVCGGGSSDEVRVDAASGVATASVRSNPRGTSVPLSAPELRSLVRGLGVALDRPEVPWSASRWVFATVAWRCDGVEATESWNVQCPEWDMRASRVDRIASALATRLGRHTP